MGGKRGMEGGELTGEASGEGGGELFVDEGVSQTLINGESLSRSSGSCFGSVIMLFVSMPSGIER